MHISLRNIIEIGLKSVVQDTTTTIATSLYDIQFWGYNLEFIFVLANIYTLNYGSLVHTMYTNILQEAMDISVESKQKDVKVFILKETIYQLFQ